MGQQPGTGLGHRSGTNKDRHARHDGHRPTGPEFQRAGTSSSRLTRPSGMAYDPIRKHLFVKDLERIVVFDVSDKNLDRQGGLEAFAVIGQKDFTSREPRQSLRKINNGPMSLDYKYHRLFIGSFTENRVMIFDVNPDKLEGASNPDAIAVLGQPDFESTDPAVTQTRLTMTRITVDTEKQLAYVPDGYPAGNHINIFDIHPDRMKQFLTPMVDQIGHINPEGSRTFWPARPMTGSHPSTGHKAGMFPSIANIIACS